MDQQFTAPETRQELLTRVAQALTSNDELDAVEFLRDDLAFDPDNRSIIGPVLREDEFDAWRDLMEFDGMPRGRLTMTPMKFAHSQASYRLRWNGPNVRLPPYADTSRAVASTHADAGIGQIRWMMNEQRWEERLKKADEARRGF